VMQVKSSFCWLAGVLVSAIACADGHHAGGNGLGSSFNLDRYAGRHQQLAVGGSSPAVNPQ
jgi:hypothetical protein